jgi:hypothetical protein
MIHSRKQNGKVGLVISLKLKKVTGVTENELADPPRKIRHELSA